MTSDAFRLRNQVWGGIDFMMGRGYRKLIVYLSRPAQNAIRGVPEWGGYVVLPRAGLDYVAVVGSVYEKACVAVLPGGGLAFFPNGLPEKGL